MHPSTRFLPDLSLFINARVSFGIPDVRPIQRDAVNFYF